MLSPWYPDAGELVWTDFTPTLGREQSGRRPALVVSGRLLTERSGLAIVCPITSRVRNYPTGVLLPPGLAVAGEILLSHIRSIDIFARPVAYAGGTIPRWLAAEVRAKLDAMIRI
ncbi:MAG: type II toxin-antitoxin system PemK/MazF family toxin [Acetobacteraceae bacterium]|nr:type II toxin-antitoxin system PemK/MazF family toxin [Acetobacteraceae bacterium]